MRRSPAARLLAAGVTLNAAAAPPLRGLARRHDDVVGMHEAQDLAGDLLDEVGSGLSGDNSLTSRSSLARTASRLLISNSNSADLSISFDLVSRPCRP